MQSLSLVDSATKFFATSVGCEMQYRIVIRYCYTWIGQAPRPMCPRLSLLMDVYLNCAR